VIAAGLLIAAVGAIVLAELSVSSSFSMLAADTTLLGLGCGPIGVLGTDILVAAVPAERAGAASAVSETATELGGALGIALLGSLGSAVYRSTLTSKLPAAISPATEGASRSTLGGAVDAASHLHRQLADWLLHAVKLAFTHGFAVAGRRCRGDHRRDRDDHRHHASQRTRRAARRGRCTVSRYTLE
jgi:DHA2 family multidrug resistance protein-like MFS transporter